MAPWDRNPYEELLTQNLEAQLVSVVMKGFGVRALLSDPRVLDAEICHLHWLHPLYCARSGLETWARVVLLIHGLRHFRAAGGKVVWTMHNLWPHDRRHPGADAYVRRFIHGSADAIICHDDGARDAYRQAFGDRQGLFVVPHGAYSFSLSVLLSKQDARRSLGLGPEGVIALQFGSARPYKGSDRLASALPTLSSEGIHVIFAGRGYCRSFARGHRNATVLGGFICDEEVKHLFSASDALVLPYRECTTSGLATLGVGFGLPLVCSPVGPLVDLCEDGLGVLCDVDEPSSVAQAIVAASAMGGTPSYSAARQRYLEGRDWGTVARMTRRVYEYVLELRD